MPDLPSGYWPALAAAAVLASAPAVAQHEQHTPPAAQPDAPPAQHTEHARAPPPTSVTEAERAAAFPDLGDMRMSDMMLENPRNKLVLLDRFEWRDAPGGDPLIWDLDAWIGRDLTKLWIRSEGERRSSDTEHAELEVLWGKSFSPWWELVAGARRDFARGDDATWGAIGVRGTAPYGFEIEATAYAGDGGRTALRLETTYEVLVTNRLILEPQLEVNWHGQGSATHLYGPGLGDAELALRLRYELRREVAPYFGVVRERSFGRTADLQRVAGRETDDTRWVAGIRLWF
jgi:copper resistance protein B